MLLIVSGSTVNTLLKENIEPDYVVSIDSQEVNYNHFKDLKLKHAKLIYSMFNHYKIRESFYNDAFYFVQKNEKALASHLNNIVHTKVEGIYGGESVANYAFTIANYISSGPIALIGQDLAYTDTKSHAENNKHFKMITEEDIRMLVDQGSQKGSINPNEQEMIHNIFEFDNKYAQDVMTHRTEVSLLWLEESEEDWEKTINESRHTYYPVCHESTDNVIGVLNTKDYFRLKDKSRKNVLEKAVRPAYFVPETVRTDILFNNMKKTRNHFAVVLDDYGGMTGIITINDLLEQLVGNLDDDVTIPVEPPPIERIDSKTWKVQGSAPIELVAKQLNIELPDIEEYDTFGGFVFGMLGTIPADGTTPELDILNLHIKVLSIKDHRMEKAIVYVEADREEEKVNKANGKE